MINPCLKKNIVSLWIFWRFFTAPKRILTAWKNILFFNYRYFSLKELFFSLFAHWRKDALGYGKGVDFQRWFNAFMGNLISRVVGFVIRTFLIVIGLFCQIIIFLAGILVLLFWILMPFIVLSGFLLAIGIFAS